MSNTLRSLLLYLVSSLLTAILASLVLIYLSGVGLWVFGFFGGLESDGIPVSDLGYNLLLNIPVLLILAIFFPISFKHTKLLKKQLAEDRKK